MYYLFEESDSLNTPIECFIFDAAHEQFPVRPHWHYFAEIIYILDGTAEMHSGEDVFVLSVGDMIVFHPHTVHSIYSLSGARLQYAVLKFDISKLSITASYLPKLRSIFRSAAEKNLQICFYSEELTDVDCKNLFENCINEINTGKYGYDIIVRAKICTLLMCIIRKWLTAGFVIDGEVFGTDNHYDIENITEYIDSKMGENISVSEIAAKCGLSYSCFAKKFHALYGKSCKEYIETMRIFKVEEFLLFTDFDLNYISQETGFSDCSHMIKSFKKYRSCTPKQFRINKSA